MTCARGKRSKTPETMRRSACDDVSVVHSQTGFCKWADKCLFAHGVEEIKAKTHVPIRYKTKKCENYSKTGFCPYGQRCLYIHNLSYVSMLETFCLKFAQSENRASPQDLDRFILSQHAAYEQSDTRAKRLPVFAALMQEASVESQQKQAARV